MPRFTPRQGYVQRQIAASYAVCRVEMDGQELGTGFLVGPDTVLTNHHVLQGAGVVAEDGKTLMAAVFCRFDVDKREDLTITDGTRVSVAACVAFSRASAWEYGSPGAQAQPTMNELDYALLQLDRPIGTDVREGARRGWIALPETQPPIATSQPIHMVQHPLGGPAVFATGDGVLGFLQNGLRNRLIYAIADEPGSSGSPCFNDNWQIIALHNWGDANVRRGIPIGLIRQDILSKGCDGAIPPLKARDAFETMRDRLVALRNAADDSDVKDFLANSIDVLEGVSESIDLLRMYKELHEFFHNVQTGILRSLLAAAPPDGSVNLESIAEFADLLAVRMGELIEMADAITMGKSQDKLRTALVALQNVAQRLSAAPGDDTRNRVLEIRQLVRKQMTKLNKALQEEAKKIGFNGLGDLFRQSEKIAAIAVPTDDKGSATEAVIRINEDFKERILQHSGWQEVENPQFLLEDLVRGKTIEAMGTFKETWRFILEDVKTLCAKDLASPLLIQVIDHGQALDETISKNEWGAAGDAFGKFRRRTIAAFSEIDRNLLARAQQIAKLSEQMRVLLNFARGNGQ